MKPDIMNLKNPKGFTLLASLILLVMMSLFGVVAVNLAVQETRIAANFEGTLSALAWAEAGVEAARQQILTATDPEVAGFSCDSAATTHYYPDAVAKYKARYCIELLSMELRASNENRGSGQDQGRSTKIYHYKIDSFFERTENGQPVTIRQVQTIEQQTRYSL